MLTVSRRHALPSVMLTTLLGVAVLADDAEFEARLREARDAVVSGAGKDYYDGDFARVFDAEFNGRMGWLRKCRDETGEAGANFDLLVSLSGEGRVEAAMVRPESKTATCCLEHARRRKFPKPPSPRLWVAVRLRVGTQEAVDVPPLSPTSPTHVLIASLSSSDPSIRASAAWQLAGARELQGEARAALEPLQADADQGVRYSATWALGHLRSPSEATATALGSPPKVIHRVRPQYPKAAFAAGVEGSVLVAILVGEEGEVAHIEVRKSIPDFDAAARACVGQWRFEPARVDGVPRSAVAHVPVSYRIY